MTTERIHELGIKRHGAAWARANQRAVEALTGCDLKPWDRGVKESVSAVVLRVLDGVQLDAGNEWLAENGQWTVRTPKICAGCNVKAPWEHRCHGSGCECKDCA